MFHSTAIMLKAAEQFHSQDPMLSACLAISSGGYVPVTCATATRYGGGFQLIVRFHPLFTIG